MSKFKILRKPLRKPELNFAPLVDMVFLLLIFFMVATTMEKDYGIEINRPEAVSVKKIDEKSLVIAISKEGEYFFDKERVTLRDVKSYFITKPRDRAQKGVIILADEKAQTKELINLLDTLRESGVKSISIAAEEK